MKALKHINKYFYAYRYRLIAGIIITITARIFLLFTPELIGNTINIVEDYSKGVTTDLEIVKSNLLRNTLYIIGAAAIGGFFVFLMRQTIIKLSRLIEYDLKNEIYQHYQKLSLSFYKTNRTGDLMNRISEDVSKVRDYAGPAIMYSINTITLFIIVITLMYNQAPKLTLYTLFPLPILSVVIYVLSKIIHKKSTIVQIWLSKLSSFTQESFSGIAVIKAFGIERNIDKEFNQLSTESRQKQLQLTKVQALFYPLMILLIGISNLIVIYIGGMQYINGDIQHLGTIAKFIIYVNMLTWPVATVGWVTSVIQLAEASQKRINEFLKQKPRIKNYQESPSNINGDISFHKVSFTYPDTNIQALKNISFFISKGQSLGIIGKTGSGKSTILELIGRLYDTNHGDIKIDGIPIKEIHLESLRNAIGYVPQDAFLFSDTISNNIKFGKEEASPKDIIEAAKQSDIHDNISLFTNGYETVLGERGLTLSGGQKQRIAIARAIIKDPKILLFDDCLSAVDTETEESILKNLNKISSGKTTVIVSHRISSIKNSDKIIVLKDGEIIQSGTHDTLLNTSGYYKSLYEKQLTEKEVT